MQPTFPRQDILESKKNDRFFKDCADYAIGRYLRKRSQRIAKINRLRNSYNGINEDAENTHLNKTYGADNRIKYIDYRLCRAKIDLIQGEQLSMPLNGTVYTTNPEARVEKLEKAMPLIGMYHAAPEVEKLRSMVGVDIFGGMPVPEVPEGKSIFDTLPAKSKNEMIMQLIVERQIDDMKLKQKNNENMQDVTLVSECCSKVYINAQGEVEERTILPENAICEESERDPFGDRSLVKGEMRKMFVHDIISEFRPNESQRNKIQELVDKPEAAVGDCYENFENSLQILVFTVEWIGFERNYLKIYTDKKGETREVEMSVEYYEKNKKRVDKEVEKGKYKLETGYKKVLYEITRVGSEDLDIYFGLDAPKVKYMPASLSDPSWTMSRYVMLLFNTQNGVRISIKQLTEHLDRSYNLVMWQINRELAKAKGKAVTYDSAMLPPGRTMKDVAYQVMNDNFIVYNSAADGMTAEKSALAAGFKEIDLGVSQTIGTLIPLKQDLEATADRITGILQNRMGDIPASSTAYSAQQSIQASRTTTAPLFYFFNQFVERKMRLILALSKISWGILKPEKGEMILGKEMMQFLKVTEDIAFDDYGYSLGDMTRELKIRDIIRAYLPQAINANPELLEAAIKSEIEETVAGAQGVISNAFAEIRKRLSQEAAARAQEAMALQQEKSNAAAAVAEGMAQKDMAVAGVKEVGGMAREMAKGRNQAAIQRGAPGRNE